MIRECWIERRLSATETPHKMAFSWRGEGLKSGRLLAYLAVS